MNKLVLFFLFCIVTGSNFAVHAEAQVVPTNSAAQKAIVIPKYVPEKYNFAQYSDDMLVPMVRKPENSLLIRTAIVAIGAALGYSASQLAEAKCLAKLKTYTPGSNVWATGFEMIGGPDFVSDLAGNYIAGLSANLMTQFYNVYRLEKSKHKRNTADVLGSLRKIRIFKPLVTQIFADAGFLTIIKQLMPILTWLKENPQFKNQFNPNIK